MIEEFFHVLHLTNSLGLRIKNYIAVSLCSSLTLFTMGPPMAYSAEPYLNRPFDEPTCGLPVLRFPPAMRGRIFPSDECRVIFYAPSFEIEVKNFSINRLFSPEFCWEIENLEKRQIDLSTRRAALAERIVDGQVSPEEWRELASFLEFVQKYIDDEQNALGLFQAKGSEITLGIFATPTDEIRLIEDLNPQYEIKQLPWLAVFPAFEARRASNAIAVFGEFANKTRSPALEYWAESELFKIPTTSPILQSKDLPILSARAFARRGEALLNLDSDRKFLNGHVILEREATCRLTDPSQTVVFLFPQGLILAPVKVAGGYSIILQKRALTDVLEKFLSSGVTLKAGLEAALLSTPNSISIDATSESRFTRDQRSELRSMALKDISEQLSSLLSTIYIEYAQRNKVQCVSHNIDFTEGETQHSFTSTECLDLGLGHPELVRDAIAAVISMFGDSEVLTITAESMLWRSGMDLRHQ
jgi:hypothetical protein